MDKIVSLEEIQASINSIRDLRSGFITNFFIDLDKHTLWINKGDCYAQRIGNTYFIIKDNEGFRNIFYNSTDADALINDLKTLKEIISDKSIVIDVVERLNQNNEIAECLIDSGFKNICSIERMSRLTPIREEEYFEEDGNIVLAENKHAEQIYYLLNTYFDKELEQIPYRAEIIDFIKKEKVYVCTEADKVVGFVIFEKNKTTLYLRYWFVCPEFRDKHIGSKLLKRFFFDGKDTKRQLLWVVKTNENSVKRYRHYGFKEDGLVDKIFINGNFLPNHLTTNDLDKNQLD